MWPAIITICVILGLWLIVIFSVALVLHSVMKNMKQKEHAINVLLAQKFDLLVALGVYMEKKDIEIPENIKEALNIQDYTSFKTINTVERLSVKTLLMKTVQNMFFIAEQNSLADDKRYITLKHSINEIDEQHRKDVALYNTQVLAYNYWIKFFPFRPISFLCRMKAREIMY